MPTNVTTEYKKAEQAFRQARDPHERLVCLKEMLRTLPKHNGLARKERFRALANGLAHDPHDVVQDLVLGPEDDDEGQDGALRHLIDRVRRPDRRDPPQALDGDAPLRHAIEPPTPFFPSERGGVKRSTSARSLPKTDPRRRDRAAIEEPVGVSVPERRA